MTKKEFIDPHKLGAGLKLGEQLGGHVGSALVILCAAMRERRGGGDFDWDSNYYGPERGNSPEHNMNGGPVIEEYNDVAKRTIGRWAGDQIALVGDYAENSDLPAKFKAKGIYRECRDGGSYTDITDDVVKVIEHECDGKFTGDGWRDFVPNHKFDPCVELVWKELKKPTDFGSLEKAVEANDKQFFQGGQIKPGMALRVRKDDKDKVIVVGHTNELAGVCDDCNMKSEYKVVAYSTTLLLTVHYAVTGNYCVR